MAYTTINKGTAHFKSNPYTGTGSSMSVTGVGFDLIGSGLKQEMLPTHHTQLMLLEVLVMP